MFREVIPLDTKNERMHWQPGGHSWPGKLDEQLPHPRKVVAKLSEPLRSASVVTSTTHSARFSLSPFRRICTSQH